MYRKFLVALAATATCGSAQAATIFTENFNGYTGTAVGKQAGTGLDVYTNGTVPGWNYVMGNGAIGAIDRGNGNYAIIFSDGNLMYNSNGIAANNAGTSYTVSFAGSFGVSTNPAQKTQSGDYVQFIVNDANGTIGSYQYRPDTATATFSPASFSYVGSGRGAIFLVIKDGLDNNGTYGGAIDNLSISDGVTSPAAPVPEPAGWILMISGFGLIGTALRRRSGMVGFA